MKKIFGYLSVMMVVLFTSCATVEPGHEGFMFKQYSGGVEKDVIYKDGTHAVAPWNEMITYDMREKTLTLQLADVLDKNGLNIGVDIAFMYKPMAGKSPYIHTSRGEDYQKTVVLPTSTGAVREIIKRYTAEDIYSGKVADLETSIMEAAKDDLEKNYISLNRVILQDIDPPKSITDGIVANQKQEQDNLLSEKKKKFEENQAIAKLAKAEGDKNKRIKGAEGKAEAMRIEAQAEAESIKLVQAQLRKSPQYNDYVRANKWDGSYGSGNVFGINSGIGILKSK
jgi:regulator of protease activity HflC (stomatin/prohibitin superfamily)